MKRYWYWAVVSVALLALVVLAVWTSFYMPLTPRASEAWSRGRIIGQTPVKRPVTLQPAPGGGMFLAWSNLDGRLELAHIGVDGEVLLDRVLAVETERARDPQLQVGTDGRLHLLWREEGGEQADIRYALLEADGTPVDQPQVLASLKGKLLDAPRLARGMEGRVYALWADDDGIHWATLNGAGNVLTGPALLIPNGRLPIVQVDDKGWLHLVWGQGLGSESQSIYYASLNPEEGQLDTREEIANLTFGDRLKLEEVALGLSLDTGYVLWSEYDRTFDRYRFQYVSFPLDAPQQRQTHLWKLKLGNGPLSISSPPGQHTPLPVALSEVTLGAGGELELQIALITMGQDELEEQVVTASAQASVTPILIVDDRSYLHLAWLDTGGFGRYQVVYASTAPEVMQNYNALTLWDVSNAVFSSLFRVSTVVVAVVVAFIMWAILPLLGLVVYHLVTGEETLSTVRSQVVLGAVLAVEVVLTFILPPRMGIEAAWPALRWVVPAATATVTAIVTSTILRRRGQGQLFVVFFLFTGLNSLMQMALYLIF